MNLVRMIYYSHVSEGFALEDMVPLLERAIAKNRHKYLTGFITFTPSYFLQVLEGGTRNVNDLYATLLRDERHDRLTLLSYHGISARRFAQWSMGHLSMSQAKRAVLLKYSTVMDLNPARLDAESALGLLEELSRLGQEPGDVKPPGGLTAHA